MLKCEVWLRLPLPSGDLPDIRIAEYEFDPGLQLGDKVFCNLFVHKIVKEGKITKCDDDCEINHLETMVVERHYLVDQKEKGSITLRILLEAADKDKLSKYAEIIKHNSKST